MKPTQASLNHPSMHTQPAAMRLTSLGQQRPDMSLLQLLANRLRVIPSVSLRLKRTLARPASLALDSRYGIHQLKGLGDIVSVRASQPDRQWNALGIGYDMMLATRLRPVRGVGACFCPQKLLALKHCPALRESNLCAQLLAGAQGIPSGCAPRLPTGANL